MDNWLITNTIHFSGMLAFSDRCLSEPLIHLIDLIFRMWAVRMRLYEVIYVHIGFIVNFRYCRFIAVAFAKKLWLLIGVFMGFDR